MKVNLMFADKDFVIESKPCFHRENLLKDLGLNYIISVMAQGDEVISQSCTTALLNPLVSIETIRYRQEILKDTLNNRQTVLELYQIVIETEKKVRESWYWLSTAYLSSTMANAIGLLKIYIEMLMKLRKIADNNLSKFQSSGFKNFFSILQRELDDQYFNEVNGYLNNLSKRDEVLVSAHLGNYLQGVRYVFRYPKAKGFWRHWAFAPAYALDPRDELGAIDLGKRRDRAINEVVNVLAQAAEHLQSYFALLQRELAFYVGCINLANTLAEIKMPICIPDLLPMDRNERSCTGFYDGGLALTKGEIVVGNDLNSKDKLLFIITGANQGGKTTFLRSIGQGQLMAQCGMFVCGEKFIAPIRSGVFTHFKKEEDKGLEKGKLDEELSRMNRIIEEIQGGALMLFNESFASTNEYEGSEIAKQITRGLTHSNVEVFFVTHFYTYATAFLNDPKTQFLKAERLENGERTFKIIPGEPERTAFGEDIYRKIFF